MIPAWVDGTLTPVEKLEVHKKGLKHRAISVFILNGDKVLMQQRALSKYHTPGQWANTCCTHPHWNEETPDGAIRRIKEELGISGITLEFKRTIEYRADVGDDLIEHEVVDIFVGHADDKLETKLNPDEVMAIDWISLDDLNNQIKSTPQKFTPWIKIYMEHYSDVLN